MNRHERWILEAAVDSKLSLRALTACNVGEFLNRPHHGLDHRGVADVIWQLLRQGLIVVFAGEEEILYPDKEELRQVIEGDRRGPASNTTSYALTASGGTAWEKVALPDWGRYIDASFGADPNDAEVICADLARLDAYVFSPHQQHCPIPQSIRRDRLEPWQATYWKMLPVGHRVRFVYEAGAPVQEQYGSDAWLKQRAWMRDLDNWFTPDRESR
jgi:hypothetical protein